MIGPLDAGVLYEFLQDLLFEPLVCLQELLVVDKGPDGSISQRAEAQVQFKPLMLPVSQVPW